MKTINVETAATKDLVAFYNANAAHFGKKVVTKFADRATAELRVRQMVADLEAEESVKNKTAAVKTDEHKAPKVSTTRSKGISESWNSPEVAAKRAQRHNVKVVLDGKEKGVFRSTLEAFKKLNLPQSGHIKFRMALKAAGQKEFVSGKHTYQFSLVEQKELPLTK